MLKIVKIVTEAATGMATQAAWTDNKVTTLVNKHQLLGNKWKEISKLSPEDCVKVQGLNSIF